MKDEALVSASGYMIVYFFEDGVGGVHFDFLAYQFYYFIPKLVRPKRMVLFS